MRDRTYECESSETFSDLFMFFAVELEVSSSPSSIWTHPSPSWMFVSPYPHPHFSPTFYPQHSLSDPITP